MTLARTILLGFGISSAATLGIGLNTRADEPLPGGLRITRMDVQPSSIELTNRFDYCQIVVTGRTEAGDSLDLTRACETSLSGGVATLSDRGVLRPLGDGQGVLTVRWGDEAMEVPIQVKGYDVPYRVSFVTDIMPAMSKMGCNAGTCHGSAKGQNGFKLSLRGYDPVFDYRALTDDLASRRFNRAAPDQSLMLLKTSGVVPHVGGTLTEPGQPYYEMLRSWIASGVPLDLDAARVESIALEPQNPIVPRQGMKQQMRVLARYTDGRIRDVTSEAFIESGNIEIAEADKQGLITALRRGEAPLLARFEGAYTATTLTVMGDRTGFAWPEHPPQLHNFIDALVYEKLQRVKTLPGDLTTDAEFIRRVYLDLTGLPPSAAAVRAFLSDPRPTQAKRDELVDQLVGGPAYVEFWTNKWADLLQVNRKFLGREGAWAFRNWIKQAVASNMPYDQFVRAILTASGSNIENPPASYFKVLRGPEEIMENTTQLFLAIRFNCNKCHDHPFERWTQGQYYELASYFARVGFKPDPLSGGRRVGGSAVDEAQPLFEVVYEKSAGDILNLRTNATALPRFPYTYGDTPEAETSRREQIADWITSPHNPYFASSYVNRLWGYLLGVGLIEPIDDIRAGNPPSNPELLKQLTVEFISSGFDVQHMVRTICKSRTYQHSIATNRWNEDDTLNYSHALARRLPAEVLYDAIHEVLGAQRILPEVPAGFRAVELPDPGVSLAFLEDFGRPARESACECERSSGVMLGPIMKLINGSTIADAVADPNNAIAKLVATQLDDEKVVEEIFLRILARLPNEDERAAGLAALRDEAIRQERDELAERLRDRRAELDASFSAWLEGISPEAVEKLPENLREAARTANAGRSDDQKRQLQEHYLAQDADLVDLHARIAKADELVANVRLAGAQDLAWALINSPAFLFNR